MIRIDRSYGHLLFRVLLPLLVLWLLASSALAAETRVYTLQNRAADDVAAQVRDLYQASAITVSSNGQQLVVRGEPQLLDEIGTLVTSLDVAPAQLRITVRTRERIGGESSGAGVSAGNGQVSAGAGNTVISTAGSEQRSVVVQDGQSAQILSGQVRTLPFAVRGGRNPAAVLEQVATHSGFVVSPQVISGETVELNIVSFEEDPAAIEGYDTEALVTIRRVSPGEWVSLGGVDTQAQEHQSGITYQVRSSQNRSRLVDIKVDILRR